MKKVSGETIARTVILAVALINSVLVQVGMPIIPIEDETIQSFITNGFLLVSTIWAWWKNNSFTQKAIAADETLKEETK